MSDDPTTPTVWRSTRSGTGRKARLHFTRDECSHAKQVKRLVNKDLRTEKPDVDLLCDECWPGVPDVVQEVHREEEIENMLLFRGWAIGHVTYVDEGNVGADRIEGAWMELFNDEGRAGSFGGVKAFADIDPDSPHAAGDEYPGGGYFESYAFATPDAFEASRQTSGWYVDEWAAPEKPDYGEAAPQ